MLRTFLQRAGLPADGYTTVRGNISTPVKNLLVAVNHHEAKIYQIGPDRQTSTGQEIKPHDPHHFLRYLTHKNQNHQNGQRAPESPDFYPHIAAALADADRIVVVGHGTDHSNAARHLVEYLAAHYPETYARVVAELVVDVSTVRPAQLQEIGRQALGI